jgi:heparanase
MCNWKLLGWYAGALATLAGDGCSGGRGEGPAIVFIPAKMARVGSVDERFQSFNVEMIEVTGGRFWKPYNTTTDTPEERSAGKQSESSPAGMDPSLYQQRPPIDLANARLRKLTAALGPAYMRVSGTWANTTYFQDSDRPASKTPPKGFNGVLTRQQWKGVVEFSQATGAQIITSFATSPGTRDSSGVWTPAQAKLFLAYTKLLGGSIAAAEFMNEPTYAAMGGAPGGYDAAAYARDISVFKPFLKKAAPEMIFLGPGGVGEGGSFPISLGSGMIKTEDILKATGPVFDIFSYHLYAAASQRCASLGAGSQLSITDALSHEWFSRVDAINAFYSSLRDRFEPGKPLWITETADAACGGNPWASTFLDTFRYLYQHGRLAQLGVQVIAHNTLASSDYGLLDENTFDPRPNYWAAILWRKLMGTTVLDPGQLSSPNMYLYAHCLRGHPGGVAVLAINADRQASREIQVPTETERYTLTAQKLQDKALQLNGTTLQVSSDGAAPPLSGVAQAQGAVRLAPTSITFLAIPNAGNDSCR